MTPSVVTFALPDSPNAKSYLDDMALVRSPARLPHHRHNHHHHHHHTEVASQSGSYRSQRPRQVTGSVLLVTQTKPGSAKTPITNRTGAVHLGQCH
ncbi:hypothetical protein ElyMa_000044100 [Elysia marginata]|uniref:Uncharacterized protein n=1 Tax=Elysia marginata TaxID=1093978 RepID=A0AAV4EDT9_9GAST|nr:hypothetical protein ElyMa_000044100 [Elysia marginata]